MNQKNECLDEKSKQKNSQIVSGLEEVSGKIKKKFSESTVLQHIDYDQAKKAAEEEKYYANGGIVVKEGDLGDFFAGLEKFSGPKEVAELSPEELMAFRYELMSLMKSLDLLGRTGKGLIPITIYSEAGQ